MATMRKPTYAEILQCSSGMTIKDNEQYPDAGGANVDPVAVRYRDNTIIIHGDGNCMFRAIAFAVGDADLDHAELRQRVCDRLLVDPNIRDALGMELNKHVSAMRRNGEWGDEFELVAAAHVVRRHIMVWTNGAIVARYGDPEYPVIHLNYITGVHYNLHITAPRPVTIDVEATSFRQPLPAQTDEKVVAQKPSYADIVQCKNACLAVVDAVNHDKAQTGRSENVDEESNAERGKVPAASSEAQSGQDNTPFRRPSASQSHQQESHMPTYADVVRCKSVDSIVPVDGASGATMAAGVSNGDDENDAGRGADQTPVSAVDDCKLVGPRPKKHRVIQNLKGKKGPQSLSTTFNSDAPVSVEIGQSETEPDAMPQKSTVPVAKNVASSSLAVGNETQVALKGRGGRPKKRVYTKPPKRGNNVETPAVDAAGSMNVGGSTSGRVLLPSEASGAIDAPGSDCRACTSIYPDVPAATGDAEQSAPSVGFRKLGSARPRGGRPPKKRPCFGRGRSNETKAPAIVDPVHQDGNEPITEVVDQSSGAADALGPVCPQVRLAESETTVRGEAICDDGDPDTTSAVLPAAPERDVLDGVSTLTRAELDVFVGNCSHNIVVQRVETDIGSASGCDLNGPWKYGNKNRVLITYVTGDHGECRRINLRNLLCRGFCAPSRSGQLRYKFYSWLRFKDVVRKSGQSLAVVLSDEDLFHDALRQVDRCYARNPRYIDLEGLQPHMGPQTWEDRHNLLQLHYYGKGWHKYFRMLTFRDMFVSRYGDERWAEFQADPWTETVAEEHFEQLLSDVHDRLRHNHSRYTHLLEQYAGPQCHEDRGCAARMQYNVLFVTRAAGSGRDARRNTRQVAQAPPQRTVAAATGETGEPEAFFLRTCVECGTLRVLDASAAAKYPLGYFTYADRQQRVRFTCDRLVGIACDTPPDFVPCTFQEKPATWVALGMQTGGDHLPPPALKLRSLRVRDGSDNTEETQVMAMYHYRDDSRAAGWTGRHALLTRTSNSGAVTLGTVSKRRRFQTVSGCRFTAGRFTVDRPREAKCCQPWHDPSESDAEDPTAELAVTNLQVLRDIHAVYDSLRRVRCIICNQQTPGLPYSDQRVRVPERGRLTDLSPNGIVSQALSKSVLLQARSTVTLDEKFRGASGTLMSDREVRGVCIVCSPSYDVDADKNIVPRPLMPDVAVVAPDPNDTDDFVNAEPRVTNEPSVREGRGAHDDAPREDSEHDAAPTHVSMFSALNLVSTDVFADEEYRLFVKSWTRAETMVLRPIHLVVSIMRLRANKVPFSKHGSICYPLKAPRRAVSLPWYDFKDLPFVVMVQNRTDNTSTEAMVNMSTIVRARYLMTRTMQCEYARGGERPFYRFVDQQWVPFSNENLSRLQAQLSEGGEPCRDRPCRPKDLHVLLVDDVHARADKALRIQEFRTWLESGFDMADALWTSFRLSCGGEGADTTEATDVELWRVIEDFVVGLAIDAAVERHQAQNAEHPDSGDESDADEVDITMRHVVNCAVSKGWLLSTSVDNAESGGDASAVSTLLRCCEELEILGREFGNDEGGATGVAAGGTVRPQTERPDEIRQHGIARSALHHIPMPASDRENPLVEATPGYMQMAFPEVFRSGDADPYQDRRLSIRQPTTTWRQNYLHWMSRQPEAEGNVDFQFVVSSQLSRDICGQEARVAINMVDFPDGLPTKEQLMNDPVLCRRVAQSLLCLQSKMEDSDAFWRVVKQEMIGVIRYLEDPPRWRPSDIPLEVVLWQTRAVPYNHHPAIHRLCDNAVVSEALSDERYLTARLANTLRHPGIVSWMAAFIGEMDTLALARVRYGASHYMVRSEWGANANPHVHRHIISESFSRFLYDLQSRLEREVARIESEVRADDPTLERDISHSAIETRVDAAWRDCQQQYIARVKQCYTNWNAGFTKDGERTFDFAYDRKTTVCRARMAAMLDDAMATGDFVALDELYVRVINGTLRHTGHSGRGDAPSAKDGCAVRRLVIDKAATEEARAAGRRRPVKKQVIACKRRMPRPLRTEAAVVSDAHDKRLKQCETPCNDRFMGGHDPFAILHILNNIDDKAVVPGWLARPPHVEWKRTSGDDGGYQFDMVLAESRGDGSVEYALKYGFKPVAPVRTPGGVLLTALERREDADNVDHGVIKRMYNQVSASTCQSIFQAVHKNWQLPLLLKNVEARGFSLSGTCLLKPSSADADPSYVFADTLQRFDARLHDDIRSANNIPIDTFQRVMSVYEFFDTFTVTEKTIDGNRVFQIGRRHTSWGGKRICIRLKPHHGQSNADPARAQFWKYARDIVLWFEPCLHSSALMPPLEYAGDDGAIAAHWRSKYDALLASGIHVPKWVRRYHAKYHAPPEEEASGEVSDESDDCDESDAAVDDVAAVENDDDQRNLNATRVPGPYYQTKMDTMTACGPDDIDDATPRAERAAARVANPKGHDFQDRWLGDRVVNPDHVRQNYARLATLCAGDATYAAPVAPAGRQLVLPCIVKRYLMAQREWALSCRVWNAYDKAMTEWRRSRSSAEPVPPNVADVRDCPPKALRAFLLGDPGAGKSTTLRSTVHDLTEMLVEDEADWTDVVKLSAPTGCASFHMAHGATTIHRLYAIRVGQKDDEMLEPGSWRLDQLCKRLGPELGLIIFDEFSMIQRKMLRWVLTRLGQAGINLEHIGVLFVGDPAQILPIGDSPVWSLRRTTDDGKECCGPSLEGMAAFRELFRMPPVDTVEGHDLWCSTAGKQRHELTDDERRQLAQFRAAAFQGDYETVYLNEVRRTVDNDELASEFTKVVIPSFRYGRASRKHLQWLRDNTATAAHMNDDPMWAGAVTLHGNHWFSEWAEHRATVESDNARALVSFATANDAPVMAVNAQHIPAKKAAKLQKVSPKEFRSVQAVFYACSGLPLMLLENVAPTVGLFNGAHVEFVGPLYLDDDWQVTLTRAEYDAKVVVTNDAKLASPIDTPSSDKDRMYQIPVGSVIIRANGHDVGGDKMRLSELVGMSATVQLVFRTPKHPPHLPEFLVVRVPWYTDNGGPNVLGIEDADDLVPIRMVKRGREKDKRGKAAGKDDDRHTEFRVGPPLEGGSAFTGFKGQGATLQRVVAKVKAWVETPGFWTVVVSRVKHPHHLYIPEDQWPTLEELQMQRLNDDVLEAEIFERQMKINAAKTWRHYVATDGDAHWSHEENVIGDAVSAAWKRQHVRDVVADVCTALRSNSAGGVSAADVKSVIDRMAETDEGLILAEPIFVTQQQHRSLLFSKVRRGRRQSNGANASKRRASTSAGREPRGKVRRESRH